MSFYRSRYGRTVDVRMPFPDRDHDDEDLRAIATHPASPWEHREAAVAILTERGQTVSWGDFPDMSRIPEQHQWLLNWTQLMQAAATAAADTYEQVDTASAPSRCTWMKAGKEWVIRGPISAVQPNTVVLVHNRDGSARGVLIGNVGSVVRGGRIGYPARGI